MDWYIALTNTALIAVSLYIAILLFQAQAQAQNKSDERLRKLTVWQSNFAIRHSRLSPIIIEAETLRIFVLSAPTLEKGEQSVKLWQVQIATKVANLMEDWKNQCLILNHKYPIEELFDAILVANDLRTKKYQEIDIAFYRDALNILSTELERIADNARSMLRELPDDK